ATATGFLVLLLSPIPMVRSFGLLLALGIVIAFGLTLTASFAALALRPEKGGRGAPDARGVTFFAPRAWRENLRARRDAQRAEGRPSRPPRFERLLELGTGRPRMVLGVGLLLAVVGWGLGTQVETQSDIRQLAPQSITAVRELNELQ